MVYPDDIYLVFRHILDDESVLDNTDIEMIQDVYQVIGYYLQDREIEELDFNE